jgi:hypothetical protein
MKPTPKKKQPVKARKLSQAVKVIRPYADMLSDLMNRVERCSTKTLKVLRDAPAVFTETNCWWANYRVAPIVSRIAQDELYRRSRKPANDAGREEAKTL